MLLMFNITFSATTLYIHPNKRFDVKCIEKCLKLLNFLHRHHSVRLADGGVPYRGRVEINVNGTWGTVCSVLWTIKDAEVVCRMLNFSAPIVASKYAAFGEGRGPMWLQSVKCIGNESSLLDCSHNALGIGSGDHSKDVSVVCGKSLRFIHFIVRF